MPDRFVTCAVPDALHRTACVIRWVALKYRYFYGVLARQMSPMYSTCRQARVPLAARVQFDDDDDWTKGYSTRQYIGRHRHVHDLPAFTTPLNGCSQTEDWITSRNSRS